MSTQSLIERMRAFLTASGTPLPFGPASNDAIELTERELGFPLPPVLRACYLELGNGGFGPGYGIIGTREGYPSSHGTLVELYRVFQEGEALEGKTWPEGLLPFCEWGCNIFTCVDCEDRPHFVFHCDEGSVSPHRYALEDFFDGWIRGADVFSVRDAVTRAKPRRIINPFTGQPDTILGRSPGGEGPES